MNQCQDCEANILPNRIRCAQCSQRIKKDPEMQMFMTVMELVKERVRLYGNSVQNRVLMVKEDIVSCVNEVVCAYKDTIAANLVKINSYMEVDEQYCFDADMMKICDSQTYVEYLDVAQMQFNLESNEVQEGFRQALRGEFVVFRDLIKCTQAAPSDIGDIN